MHFDPVLETIVTRLESRATLTDDDRSAMRALAYTRREVETSSYLVREGAPTPRCTFLLSGFCYRQKLTTEGARQIVSIEIPGHFIDLQHLFLSESDHNVQALTRGSVAEIDSAALRKLALTRPAIGTALWTEALISASISREWIVNVGRRDAHSRVGHLLCELAVRLHITTGANERHYDLPMTQEQLGDAVGLTPVHVNRVLRALTQRGLISRDRRQIKILNWDALRDASDFNPRYLHLSS
ncbi:Crp/Fnr family transcriptional regulator [Sphingomonas sp. 10B4]|nr:Crp/Fnr family transcriptional regulator [Sphingomonas sp. 10B4]MDY7525603.1 Crp/Fnr family transcriptional regulator [Sphingomonas sp. 10B4]MEB0282616.1 Crp/Fnr family transcriptional regulator [Sphingomonas sp. 10B4]